RVDGFVECGAGRRPGEREDRTGDPADKRGRDVIADHPPLVCVGEPGQRHRPRQLRRGTPTGATITRRDKTNIQLTGRSSATSLRIVVVGKRQPRRRTRARRINRQARDEVINRARHRIDRDPRDTRPGRIARLRRRGHHDVVRRTRNTEAAVLPHNKDVARPINLRRRQRLRPQPTRNRMLLDRRNLHRCPPTRTTINRPERKNRRRRRAQQRHDHLPVRLHHRLAPQPRDIVTRVTRRPPRQPTINRRAHLHPARIRHIIPLAVATTVKRAGREIVTDKPVLIQKTTRRDRHRARKARPTIRRAIHQHRLPDHRRRLADPQRLNQPHTMPRVIGNRRITRTIKRARTEILRHTRQKAARPTRPTIRRSRPTDTRRTTIEETPTLKRRHNRRTKRKRIRLNLRPMLTRSIRKRISTQPRQRHCCGCGAGEEEGRHSQHDNRNSEPPTFATGRPSPTRSRHRNALEHLQVAPIRS
ncbi:MAG: hypothetical protein QOC92_1569, partial [Acidimicrobiaceae bacterium]